MSDSAAGPEDTVEGQDAPPAAGLAHPGRDDPAAGPRRRSHHRSAWLAAGRGLVVALLAAIGYQAVVPVSHIDRGRLAGLVSVHSGVKEFAGKPTSAGEQQGAAQSGLAALVTATNKSPEHTGVYRAEWAAPPAKDAAEVVAFAMPSAAAAQRLLVQFVSTELSANAEASASLHRVSTGPVPAIPGSSGALFMGSSPAAGSPDLAVVAFRVGTAVAVTEVVTVSGTQAEARSMAMAQYQHLRAVEPSFTLAVVDHPLLATLVWVVGAVIVTLVVALGPLVFGRFRRRREQLRQEDLDRQVRGHAITKQRRTVQGH